MKNWLLLICFFVSGLAVKAQNQFGNEWIRTGQKYLKLSVAQTGVYRVSYQDIQAADASFLQTNPTTWQLFFRGQEMAIRVVGEKDGVFNAQDYVEFYGEGNDGSQDSLLYRPRKRLHPYQTLFSDTTAYFLTSAATGTGKRMPELNNSAQGLTPEKFHVQETVQAFTSQYTFNNLVGLEPSLQQSFYEPGEGWSGPIMTLDSTGTVPIKLTDRVATDWPINLDGMVNGRDNSFHQVQVTLNSATTPMTTLSFFGFISQTFQSVINPASLQNEQLTVRFKSIKNANVNNFSITYVKLTYPQATNMAGLSSKVFRTVPNASSMALLSIQNAPANSFAYDITDKANCRYVSTQIIDGQTQAVLSEANRNRTLFVTNQISKPAKIKAIRFSSNFPKPTDYVIVTHATLQQSAKAYAAYRASDQGGRYTPFIVEADSLYDQFNYGERSPLALRRFADYMRVNTAAKYLMLIGRAESYPYNLKKPTNDLVPTIGYPGSDILLTAGLGNFPANTPAIPIGRLSVASNDQVLAYLEKVKQIESSSSNGIWRKHIIHISGGKTPLEAQGLRSALDGLANTFTNGLLGGQVSSFGKSKFSEEVETINITPLVNDGVSLITFFGHAGPAITDMNFGFASDVEKGYRNTRYPLMIFNGCGVGEIFHRYNTLSTDWLLAPQKGAGVVLAHSYYSYEQPTTWYLSKLYSALFANATTLGMPLGLVQQQLNQAIEKENLGPHEVAMLLQMVLQGDPAVSIYPLPNPDFSFGQKGIYIQSNVGGGSLKNSDSIRVVMPLANLGKFVPGQLVNVSLNKTTSTGTSSIPLRFTSFRYQDTLVYTIPREATLQKLEVVIDPNKQIVELDKANNSTTLAIDWSQIQGSSYPANALPDVVAPAISVFVNGAIRENQTVVNTTPRLDIYLLDQNSLSIKDTTSVDVFLKSCETCTPQKIPSSALSLSAVSDNQLLVSTTLSLQAGATYQLIVFGKDASGNQTQPPYVLNLNVAGAEEKITFQVNPNPATSYAQFELQLNTQELPVDSRLTIYSLSGAQVYNNTFPINAGKNSMLWQGMAPGIYVYSLQLIWKEGRTETYRGKVIWQK
ncbi:C25 family cysteine peptidase [Spirosoma sp.]|uniref:putative type IX secretion system sortase PorU2 n=1 Tax=Spirosoma sp. TaxID=1899569 RepID=UPI003B3ABAF4